MPETVPLTVAPICSRLKSSSRLRARSSSSAAFWLTISRLRFRLTSRILTGIRCPTSDSRLPAYARATWLEADGIGLAAKPELLARDDAFGLGADIDEHLICVDANHDAIDDVPVVGS